jgi:hypothetical protein
MFANVSKIELRLALASIGVLFASVAWLTAALTSVDLGHCLPGFQTADFHCPACYAAIAFLAAAVAPWSTRRAALSR